MDSDLGDSESPELSAASSTNNTRKRSKSSKGKPANRKITRRPSADQRKIQFRGEYDRAQSMDNVTNDRWVCYKEGCAQVFKNETNLGNHLTVVHREADIPCGFTDTEGNKCTKTFAKAIYRKTHYRSFHPKEEVPNIPRRKKECLGNLTFHDFLAKFINKRDLQSPESFEYIVGDVDDYKFKNVKERSKSRKKQNDKHNDNIENQEDEQNEIDIASNIEPHSSSNQQPEQGNPIEPNYDQDEIIVESHKPEQVPCLVLVTQTEDEQLSVPAIQKKPEVNPIPKLMNKVPQCDHYSAATISEPEERNLKNAIIINLQEANLYPAEPENIDKIITKDVGTQTDSETAEFTDDYDDPEIVFHVTESESTEFTSTKDSDNLTPHPVNIQENESQSQGIQDLPAPISINIPSSSRAGKTQLTCSPTSSPPPFKRPKLQEHTFKSVMANLEKYAKGEIQEIQQDEAKFILKEIDRLKCELKNTNDFLTVAEERVENLEEEMNNLKPENDDISECTKCPSLQKELQVAVLRATGLQNVNRDLKKRLHHKTNKERKIETDERRENKGENLELKSLIDCKTCRNEKEMLLKEVDDLNERAEEMIESVAWIMKKAYDPPKFPPIVTNLIERLENSEKGPNLEEVFNIKAQHYLECLGYHLNSRNTVWTKNDCSRVLAGFKAMDIELAKAKEEAEKWHEGESPSGNIGPNGLTFVERILKNYGSQFSPPPVGAAPLYVDGINVAKSYKRNEVMGDLIKGEITSRRYIKPDFSIFVKYMKLFVDKPVKDWPFPKIVFFLLQRELFSSERNYGKNDKDRQKFMFENDESLLQMLKWEQDPDKPFSIAYIPGSSYDDHVVVLQAYIDGAYILSNDQYRDLCDDNPDTKLTPLQGAFQSIIDESVGYISERRIGFTHHEKVGIILETEPNGRTGLQMPELTSRPIIYF